MLVSGGVGMVQSEVLAAVGYICVFAVVVTGIATVVVDGLVADVDSIKISVSAYPVVVFSVLGVVVVIVVASCILVSGTVFSVVLDIVVLSVVTSLSIS